MIRVTIKYFDGYPELEAELSKYPSRARAERIRNLASIGLAVLRQQSLIGSPASHDEKQAENNASSDTQQQGSSQAHQAKQKKSGSSAAIKNLFGQV